MRFLLVLAVMSFAATSVQAHGGRWHGHRHSGAAPFLFFGALTALSIPLLYTQTRATPGPYYYFDPAPPSTVYVPAPPAQTSAAAAPAGPAPRPNEVIELGPVDALPPMESGPPPDAQSRPVPADNKWFIYPRNGQSAQHLLNDRYDCSRWATHESGYDPDLRTHRNPETGPLAYGRALSACLEGRGYTVR